MTQACQREFAGPGFSDRCECGKYAASSRRIPGDGPEGSAQNPLVEPGECGVPVLWTNSEMSRRVSLAARVPELAAKGIAPDSLDDVPVRGEEPLRNAVERMSRAPSEIEAYTT